ncbi:MAG: hypothetical protein AMJ81_05225 [Phycisphaerae bacterium SM23_33]|nr:MAG: hypothetical protein AMJ81_05225 [Phycisphaerae bacterium SM23_33]
MKHTKRFNLWRPGISPNPVACACAVVTLLLGSEAARGYVEAPYTLGKIIGDSTNILLLRVEQVDKSRNLIVYRKVRDIKGTHPGETVKHNIGQGGFHPREWQNIMAWAEAGQTALFFHNGGAGEVCIRNYWYQCYPGDWWRMSHAEPYLLRTFAGGPEKLASLVAAMLTGQDVVVPCMVDGDKNALQLRAARLQRMRASLKLLDYNPKRDFVGWGVEEFRPIAGMPGFTHYAPLSRVGLGAGDVAATDLDGDGKPDFCLLGAGRLVLLQNAGGALNELPLGLDGGARAAAWADCNGDGRPDLLLATPAGAKLFANQGKIINDVSACLPRQAYHNLTAAAWIDYDGDARPDILLADGFSGLRLYRNGGPAPPAPPGKTGVAGTQLFEDVSEKVGLGAKGVGGNLKGDHLAVADVNGDGRPDFLYSAGTGLLVINTPRGFVPANRSGISYQAGGVAPAFGDFDGDKRPDLFVPQQGQCRLFRNNGKGLFSDAAAKAGALARPAGHATCAVWADFNNRGRLDLLVGCLRGPNRYFRNNGDGTFTDASREIGFHQRIFNTRGLCVLDINSDGVPDVVLNNEGQESAILLGNPARVSPPKPAQLASAAPNE